ncbi:MAG: hypothetical protein IKV03_03680 [Alphaproteobacteria bacterium]|nr:hypothetical protein [Alphaproteobacteria bacterium]
MSKTVEFIKLLSVLILSILMLGMLGFFIPKISELSIEKETENVDLSIYEVSSSDGLGEQLSQKIKYTLEKISGYNTVSASVIADVVQGEETTQKNILLPRSAVVKEHLRQYDTAQEVGISEEKSVYEYSSEIKHQTQNTQHIRKLSITVLVDGYATKTPNGHMLYQPRSEIEMASYKTLVKSLVGFSAERGDTLELINLPFVKMPDNTILGFKRGVVIQSVLLILFFVLTVLILIRFILPMIYILLQPTPIRAVNAAYATSTTEFDDVAVSGKKSVIQNLFSYKQSQVVSVIRKWLYGISQEGELSGVQKTAVLLLALGEEYIKPIFLKLKDEEVVTISRTMAELGCVSGENVQEVFASFLACFHQTGDLCASSDYVETLMENVLPASGKKDILEQIYAPVSGKNIWEKLEHTDTTKLAEALSGEYPQTIAVVLYHLSNEKASDVLGCFSESLTMDVLMRLTALKDVDDQTLAGVEQGLDAKLKALHNQPSLGGKEKAAGIISLMDRKTDILNTLFERSPELAGQLSAGVIMFEDIADWDDKSIRTLLEKMDRQVVIYALKGASDKMKEAFSRNMSPAVWGGVLKEINKLSSIKVKDIDAAQHALVRTAQELIDQKKIIIVKER